MITYRMFGATFTKAAERTFDATLSTPRDDRERDRIPLAGWVLPRSVPLLWAHKQDEFPVGRVTDIRVMGDRLRGRLEFPPPGAYDKADITERLVATGFLSNVSVGFRFLDKPKPNDLGGLDFNGRHELLELSVVNVPANVDATIDGRRDVAAMQKWLSNDADEPVLWLNDAADEEPTATFEQIAAAYRALGESARRRDEIVLELSDAPPADPRARHHRRSSQELIDVDLREVQALIAAAVTPESIVGAVVREIPEAVATSVARRLGRVD